jgi:hypothetical protein
VVDGRIPLLKLQRSASSLNATVATTVAAISTTITTATTTIATASAVTLEPGDIVLAIPPSIYAPMYCPCPCDVTVAIDGEDANLAKSQLIRQHIDKDPIIPALIRCVKHWAKQRGSKHQMFVLVCMYLCVFVLVVIICARLSSFVVVWPCLVCRRPLVS